MEEKESLDIVIDELSKLSSNPDHIILTNKELAEKLKVCSKTIQKWRDKRMISYSKIGREIFYKFSDVLEMLNNNYHPSICMNV